MADKPITKEKLLHTIKGFECNVMNAGNVLYQMLEAGFSNPDLKYDIEIRQKLYDVLKKRNAIIMDLVKEFVQKDIRTVIRHELDTESESKSEEPQPETPPATLETQNTTPEPKAEPKEASSLQIQLRPWQAQALGRLSASKLTTLGEAAKQEILKKMEQLNSINHCLVNKLPPEPKAPGSNAEIMKEIDQLNLMLNQPSNKLPPEPKAPGSNAEILKEINQLNQQLNQPSFDIDQLNKLINLPEPKAPGA